MGIAFRANVFFWDAGVLLWRSDYFLWLCTSALEDRACKSPKFEAHLVHKGALKLEFRLQDLLERVEVFVVDFYSQDLSQLLKIAIDCFKSVCMVAKSILKLF